MTARPVSLAVLRPPATREQALRVAAEQFATCPDAVWQGAGTIEQLASSLLDANRWELWWD